MLKKFFSAFAFSVFLAAPGFAAENAITVEVPATPTTAEEMAAKEAAILAAAEAVCDKVELVGIERFYSARAKASCVKEAAASAFVATADSETFAYSETTEAALN